MGKFEVDVGVYKGRDQCALTMILYGRIGKSPGQFGKRANGNNAIIGRNYRSVRDYRAGYGNYPEGSMNDRRLHR